MKSKKVSLFKRLQRFIVLIKKESIRKDRSITSIIFEMLKLYLHSSIGPNYYLLAGMADKTMSWDYKCSHLSHKDYHRVLMTLNPIPYRKITQHKLAEKSFLQLAKIPSASFIGFYDPIKGFDANGQMLTNEDQLCLLLQGFVDQKICLKVPEGYGGEGFFAGRVFVENDEIKLKCINENEAMSIPKLLSRYASVINTEGLLFESFIYQVDSFTAFNPTSVNTLRIWVLQTGENIEVIGGYLRIGRLGSLTDNGGGGGIMCPIDVETGILGKGLTTSIPFRDDFERHPDNNAQLSGVILPHWHDIIALSCETLRKLPYTKFAGIDVAVTDDGPLIIEVNVCPDKNGAANGMIPSTLLRDSANL